VDCRTKTDTSVGVPYKSLQDARKKVISLRLLENILATPLADGAAPAFHRSLAAKVDQLIKRAEKNGGIFPGKIFSTGPVDKSGAAVDMSPDCYADFNTLASCITIVQSF
jgi:hypothetical protein